MIHLGDCLEVMRGFEPESFDTILADPPYGIGYELKGVGRPLQSNYADGRGTKIANDGSPFIWWLHDAFRVLKTGGALICFCRWDVQEAFRFAIDLAGFRMRSQVIWDRGIHGVGDLKAQFGPQHDVIWFAVKGKGFAFPNGRPKSVLRHQRLLRTSHPNEKPVALLRDLLRSVTPVGGCVLDPFAGSGAGAIACSLEKMEYTGIELDQTYHRLATERCAREVA